MVLWYVTAGAGWDDIGRLCQGWGNAHEIALAKEFVASLEKGEETFEGRQGGSRDTLLGDQDGQRSSPRAGLRRAFALGEVSRCLA